MNNVTQSIDIPKNKYYQETNTYPETTTYKINGMIVNKQIFYIIRQLCSQHNSLQEEVNEKDKEIERLNNIINELEKMLEEEQDRLARECSNIYEDSLGKSRLVSEDIFEEITKIKDKLKELKEGK